MTNNEDLVPFLGTLRFIPSSTSLSTFDLSCFPTPVSLIMAPTYYYLPLLNASVNTIHSKSSTMQRIAAVDITSPMEFELAMGPSLSHHMDPFPFHVRKVGIWAILPSSVTPQTAALCLATWP